MAHLPIFKTHFTIAFFALFLILLLPIQTFAQDVLWKKNFGGNLNNSFQEVITVSDGIIAAGFSSLIGFGDWDDIPYEHDALYAVLVKYNNAGEVIWKKKFGGKGADLYYSITKVAGGFVTVGYSNNTSFNNGDWEGIEEKGRFDANIVKYDNNGNVVWKNNLGGNHDDFFYCVTDVADGVVAVGHSHFNSFGNGDWEGVEAIGNENTDYNGIIVKYDYSGNVIWKKNFGENRNIYFQSVTSVSNGVIVVGNSLIVKYDYDGNVVWEKSFGGSFYSAITVPDGFVAVGYSGSIGADDWEGFTKKGLFDAIIVKFDFEGNVLWKNNFGGSGSNYFFSVIKVSDGFVTAGWKTSSNVNSGDWEDIQGKGGTDGIIVKYDNLGNVVWKNNFGGSGHDGFESVTAVPNGVVAVGYSRRDSFGTGDWTDVTNKGVFADAIIVKYSGAGIGIIEPAQELSEVEVFPNPTTGELTIKWTSGRVNEVEIYDIYGRKQKAESRKQKAEGEVVLDVSYLAAGIYLVKITTEKGIVVKKVVKQ